MKILIKGQEPQSNALQKKAELNAQRKDMLKRALALPLGDPQRKELEQEADRIFNEMYSEGVSGDDAQYLSLMY